MTGAVAARQVEAPPSPRANSSANTPSATSRTAASTNENSPNAL
jgi:hypothetical protein